MITNVTFYELDNKMIYSMKNTIDEVLSKLSKKYESIDYSIDKQRLMVSCHDKCIKIITFSYEKIENEYDAVTKSIVYKNDHERSLSVINIGSRSYRLMKNNSYYTHFPPSREDEFYIDSRILKYLSERGVDTLFIPYVTKDEFSNPASVIERAQYNNSLDNDCDANRLSRHLKYIEENFGASAKEDVTFIHELLSDYTTNYQMIGEILFKALYPEDWEKSAKKINSFCRKHK